VIPVTRRNLFEITSAAVCEAQIVTLQQVIHAERILYRDTYFLCSCSLSAPVGKAFSPASPILADENAFPTEALIPAFKRDGVSVDSPGRGFGG